MAVRDLLIADSRRDRGPTVKRADPAAKPRHGKE